MAASRFFYGRFLGTCPIETDPLGGSFPRLKVGNMAASGHHGFLHAGVGVGRTGHHGGHPSEEHRQIVLMIANGQNAGRRHIEQATEFRKSAPLVIGTVTETQVDVAALVMKILRSAGKVFQLLDEFIERLLTVGNQATRDPVDTLLKGHSIVPVDKLLDGAKEGAAPLEKQIVVLPTEGIPLPVIMPSSPSVGLMDMPFAGEDVVGGYRGLQFADAIQSTLEGASGIHRPNPSRPGDGLELASEGGNTPPALRVGSREGSVEIRAKQSDHQETFPAMCRVRNMQFPSTPADLRAKVTFMKSAYELAMSRLEQGSPTRTLTEEQKKALAEIDSEYDAKVAERKIFLEGEIAKSAGDESAITSLRGQLTSEIASIEEKRESKKEKVRQGKA